MTMTTTNLIALIGNPQATKILTNMERQRNNDNIEAAISSLTDENEIEIRNELRKIARMPLFAQYFLDNKMSPEEIAHELWDKCDIVFNINFSDPKQKRAIEHACIKRMKALAMEWHKEEERREFYNR